MINKTMVSKKDCVACNHGHFIGEVGEIQEHLCKKHLKEHLKELTEEVKAWLRVCESVDVKGTSITYKNKI